MARQPSPWCCFCITLRGGIVLVSFFMFLVVVFLLFLTPLINVVIGNTSARDVSLQDVLDLIVVAMYGVMVIFGLSTAIKNTYKIARRFSISWWVFTGITSSKDLIEITFALTREENGLMYECFREWPKFVCEKEANALLLVRLAIHVFLMAYFGMTIRRYAQQLGRRVAVIGLPTQFTHHKSEKLEDIEEPLELK
ncbi:MAG: hypothetical protein J3Q66DRAFT_386703 [Benniella sp.]|nr:MAG: hypothetical protein J3Q66DRAFT_386703 [Benniella sp.]